MLADLTDAEAAALRGLVKACEVAGDGDLAKGVQVLGGMLKLVRATGERDPIEGLQRLEDAIALAERAATMGRFARWLAAAVVGLIFFGADLVDKVGKIAAALRGTGRVP